MSAIQRLTLISDPTDEFPNNANNSFKVRLPERLSLPGEGWHASLMSLTVPDQGHSNTVIASDPHTHVIQFEMVYVMRRYNQDINRVDIDPVDCELELQEIMNAHQTVSTGTMFWKRVMQEVQNKIMHNTMAQQRKALAKYSDQRPILSAKKNAAPQLSWKDDTLILHALSERDLIQSDKSAISSFFIHLDIALKFGLLLDKTVGSVVKYELGPNLQYLLPLSTYNASTQPVGRDFRKFYHWEGEQYMAIQPNLMFGTTGSTTVDPLQVVTRKGVKFLQLSLMAEWHFNNLDESFEKVIGTRQRTVMVYSDLVESTVVGSGKFPLLREVQLLRTGNGESTAEPRHRQWIKVRGQHVEMLEVEIATTAGPLAILPPGKTLVTIGLKRL